MVPAWAKAEEGGVVIFVRLTPKSAHDRIEGAETTGDGRVWLKARVRAVPEAGKANKALVALIAKAAGVPKSSVGVVSGQTSRAKTVRIACAVTLSNQLVEKLKKIG